MHGRACWELAHDPPSRDNEDPVTVLYDLVELAAHPDHGASFVGEPTRRIEDLRFRSDIDTPGGFVEQEK